MKRSLALIFCGFLLSVPVWAQAVGPTPTPDVAAERARADRLQSKLNDFPNLTRYQEANGKLAPPAKDEKRVVFLGDSITDGWKLAEYFPQRPYVNRGISGQTTPQMLLRFRPDVIALQPKVVVILAGTNDLSGNTGPTTLEAIEGNLTSMAELAHVHGINVVLASVLPVSDYNRDKANQPIIRTVLRPPAQIVALNAWIKTYCSQQGLVYLDYFTATVDDKGFLRAELANDGLHPNEKGYAVMKPLAEQAIQMALKK
jgi:lysophospholipase L1-like esterase